MLKSKQTFFKCQSIFFLIGDGFRKFEWILLMLKGIYMRPEET